MKKNSVLVIAFVLLTGLVLIPFVGVQGQAFRWQNYVGVYETPTPGPNGVTILIDQVVGGQGSYFTVSGFGLSPNISANVYANGLLLGNVQADSNGEIDFSLDTGIASLGRYDILVEQVGLFDVKTFFLVPNGELHPAGSTTVFNVPPNIAERIEYLPYIGKE